MSVLADRLRSAAAAAAAVVTVAKSHMWHVVSSVIATDTMCAGNKRWGGARGFLPDIFNEYTGSVASDLSGNPFFRARDDLLRKVYCCCSPPPLKMSGALCFDNSGSVIHWITQGNAECFCCCFQLSPVGLLIYGKLAVAMVLK